MCVTAIFPLRLASIRFQIPLTPHAHDKRKAFFKDISDQNPPIEVLH
jgi:hypothetical protein